MDGEIPWSTNEIAQAQLGDLDIQSVVVRLKRDWSKHSARELLVLSPLTRAIWDQYQLLELEQDVLRLKPVDISSH